MGDNLVEPSGVAISIARCDVPLRGCLVTVATPGSYKCGQVVFIFMQGNAVVSIPAVKHCLLLVVGTERAWWNGLCVWWVSRLAWRLSDCKSAVRCGSPFFFGHTTMQWHHVTGFPTGTGSRTPRATS